MKCLIVIVYLMIALCLLGFYPIYGQDGGPIEGEPEETRESIEKLRKELEQLRQKQEEIGKLLLKLTQSQKEFADVTKGLRKQKKNISAKLTGQDKKQKEPTEKAKDIKPGLPGNVLVPKLLNMNDSEDDYERYNPYNFEFSGNTGLGTMLLGQFTANRLAYYRLEGVKSFPRLYGTFLPHVGIAAETVGDTQNFNYFAGVVFQWIIGTLPANKRNPEGHFDGYHYPDRRGVLIGYARGMAYLTGSEKLQARINSNTAGGSIRKREITVNVKQDNPNAFTRYFLQVSISKTYSGGFGCTKLDRSLSIQYDDGKSEKISNFRYCAGKLGYHMYF